MPQVQPGNDHTSAGRTHRARGKGIGKADPFLRQSVDYRGAGILVAIASDKLGRGILDGYP